MTRAEAQADILAAASSGEVLGGPVMIDGTEYTAVKGGLSVDERHAFAAAGMSVEGLRISIDVAALGFQPTLGSWLNVDGRDYEVVKARLAGSLLKMTLIRNVG